MVQVVLIAPSDPLLEGGLFFMYVLTHNRSPDRTAVLNSPPATLFNLKTCSPSEARRMWKDSIKEKWKHKCAYCGEKSDELSLDHIVPQAKGGNDHITNVCCACVKCNRDKSHS